MLLAPALILTELALIPASIAAGWGRQKLAAIGEVIRWLPRLLRERRQVQATRTVSAAEFAAWLTPDLDSPFIPAIARSLPARLLLRSYWRAVRLLLRLGPQVTSRRARRPDQDLVDVDVGRLLQGVDHGAGDVVVLQRPSPGRLSKNGVSTMPGSIRVTLIPWFSCIWRSSPAATRRSPSPPTWSPSRASRAAPAARRPSW